MSSTDPIVQLFLFGTSSLICCTCKPSLLNQETTFADRFIIVSFTTACSLHSLALPRVSILDFSLLFSAQGAEFNETSPHRSTATTTTAAAAVDITTTTTVLLLLLLLLLVLVVLLPLLLRLLLLLLLLSLPLLL